MPKNVLRSAGRTCQKQSSFSGKGQNRQMSKKTDSAQFGKPLNWLGAIVSGCPQIERVGQVYPARSMSQTRPFSGLGNERQKHRVNHGYLLLNLPMVHSRFQLKKGQLRPVCQHLPGRDRGRSETKRHFMNCEKAFLNWHFQC